MHQPSPVISFIFSSKMRIRNILFILLVYVATLYWAHTLLMKYDDRQVALKQGILQAGKAQIVLLGDSHLAYAAKNKYLPDSILAFAYPGESLAAHEMKLRSLISQNRTPKQVVLQLEPHMFHPRRNGATAILGYWPYVSMKDQWQSGKHMLLLLKQLAYLSCPLVVDESRLLLQSVIIREKLLNQKINNYKSWYYDHFADLVLQSPLQELPTQTDTLQLNNRVDILLNMKQPDQQLITQLKRLINLCNNNNIRLVLIETPVSMPMQKQYQKYDALFHSTRSLAKMHNLHYLKINFNTENSHLFYNYDHLNERGAREFSKKLVYALKENSIHRQ